MKRLLAITLAGSLLLAAFPGAALAGDRHDASDRWAGLAIGAAAAVVGGVLLNALTPAPAPPVAYASPPVVYFPPPPVVYAPPAVVYMPPPVVYKPAPVVVHREIVVHREVAPRGRWDLGYNGPGRGWDRR